ncbi:alpha/beta fold hydrolase [Nonomuraea lactucae]|uniref:alpha/beta fold hydrolase n=1 Tax=Nonomuraea lactucae TaxID=2249762 RepID=UPI000DE365C5|nr:alpha/beta hydrolase [Nonomuraea lactucae]
MRTVTSKDGTPIAFDRVGDGPAVILVSGATADRKMHTDLAQALAGDFTVLNHDRRGRGDSGDTLPFALEREFEDIDALIAEAGGSAHLYGISSGGALALEAAAAGLAIDRLAVYEVPYNLAEEQPRLQEEYVTTLNALLAQDRRSDMVALFMRTVAEADDHAISAMRQEPWWAGIEAVAHTLAYDAAALGTGRPPAERLGRIKAPTCVITGLPEGEQEVGGVEFFEATARAIVAAIPSAEHRRLPGQTHMVSADALAPVLTSFFKS